MEDKVERISPRFAILATNTGWDRGIFAHIMGSPIPSGVSFA